MFRYGFLLILLALLSGITCRGPEKSRTPEASLVYQPSYATGFSVWKSPEGKVLARIHPLGDSLTFTEIDLDTKALESLKRRGLAVLSTTHLPYLEALGQLSQVKGVTYAHLIKSATVRALIHSGSIADLSGEREVDHEKLIGSGAGFVTTYPGISLPGKIMDQGDMVEVPIVEYIEQHPLGRAEWLVFFGYLTGEERKAQLLFEAIDSAYTVLQMQLAEAHPRPAVFAGSSYSGVWYAPAGNSLSAKLIADAGGNYLYVNRLSKNNLALDLETVMMDSQGCDWWGMVRAEPIEGYEDLLREDARYALLAPVQNRRVFVCSTADNDYFEGGLLRPHDMLADLGAIFHPALLPGHDFVYFRILPD